MQKFWLRRQYQPLLLVVAITGNGREDLAMAVLLLYVKEDPFLIYTSVLVRRTFDGHITCLICRFLELHEQLKQGIAACHEQC